MSRNLQNMKAEDKFFFFLGAFVFLCLVAVSCVYLKACLMIACGIAILAAFCTCFIALLYFLFNVVYVFENNVLPAIKAYFTRKELK